MLKRLQAELEALETKNDAFESMAVNAQTQDLLNRAICLMENTRSDIHKIEIRIADLQVMNEESPNIPEMQRQLNGKLEMQHQRSARYEQMAINALTEFFQKKAILLQKKANEEIDKLENRIADLKTQERVNQAIRPFGDTRTDIHTTVEVHISDINAGYADFQNHEDFIRIKLKELLDTYELQENEKVLSRCIRVLSEKSKGSFEYIRLLILDVDHRWSKENENNVQPHTMGDLLRIFIAFKGKEDDLYLQILSREFEDENEETITCFRQVMEILVAESVPVRQELIKKMLPKSDKVGSIIIHILDIVWKDENGAIFLPKNLKIMLTQCKDGRFFINADNARKNLELCKKKSENMREF
ncbi:hypothetical protein HK100_008952 [Physocladia obscura]|uniref:Uncharacterized protein n=1 Tax=Physocladia obscura TaxID=109957 RepID=A0AAD5SP17_9FUNG|nr:hypothetical protein HK100_008952 [Physocladia obscura]